MLSPGDAQPGAAPLCRSFSVSFLPAPAPCPQGLPGNPCPVPAAHPASSCSPQGLQGCSPHSSGTSCPLLTLFPGVGSAQPCPVVRVGFVRGSPAAPVSAVTGQSCAEGCSVPAEQCRHSLQASATPAGSWNGTQPGFCPHPTVGPGWGFIFWLSSTHHTVFLLTRLLKSQMPKIPPPVPQTSAAVTYNIYF